MGTLTNHYDEPNPKHGNSRKGGDASQAVKDTVKAEIIKQAQAAGLGKGDIQNLLAIAERESGFNPDAANKSSTASLMNGFRFFLIYIVLLLSLFIGRTVFLRRGWASPNGGVCV